MGIFALLLFLWSFGDSFVKILLGACEIINCLKSLGLREYANFII